MTQQHGLYTVQTWLTITAEQRARLEWLVRDQGGDLADTLTRIVADCPLSELRVSPEPPSGDTLPARLYLTAEQRRELDRLVAESQVPLPDVLSQIVAAFLATVADPPEEPQPPPDPAERRRRRAELARLRARRDQAGGAAPAWLDAYIAELESDLDP
ncbi:MAG: hypothetical protein DIU80_016970 [Chloroflexota bacterium]